MPIPNKQRRIGGDSGGAGARTGAGGRPWALRPGTRMGTAVTIQYRHVTYVHCKNTRLVTSHRLVSYSRDSDNEPASSVDTTHEAIYAYAYEPIQYAYENW